jgi:hypothetical protein
MRNNRKGIGIQSISRLKKRKQGEIHRKKKKNPFLVFILAPILI